MTARQPAASAKGWAGVRRYAFSQWAEPPEPHPANVERWERFCSEIDARIDTVKAEEGHEPMRCFGTDMLDFAAPIPLPVGRLVEPTAGSFGQPTRRRAS